MSAIYIFLLTISIISFLAYSASWDLPMIWDGLPMSSDSLHRIAWLRWLDSGGVRGTYFTRDGAPWGYPHHWTMPYDYFLLVTSWPAEFLFGQDFLVGKTFVVSWLSIVFLQVAALAWLASLLGLLESLPWAIVLWSVSPSMRVVDFPTSFIHHGFTCALGLFVLSSCVQMAKRPNTQNAIMASMFSVLALWSSAETVPLVTMSVCLISIVAGIRKRSGKPEIVFSTAMGLFATAACFVDRDAAGFFETDRLSLIHAIFFSMLGASSVLGVQLASGSVWRRICIILVPFGGCCAAFAFYSINHSPAAFSDPIITASWHVWNPDLFNAFSNDWMLLRALQPTSLAFLFLAIGLWRKRRQPQIIYWIVLSVIFGVLYAMSLMLIRLDAYSTILGSLIIGSGTKSLFKMIFKKSSKSFRDKFAAYSLALLSLAFIFSDAPVALALLQTKMVGHKVGPSLCYIGDDRSQKLEAALGKNSIVLSDLNMAPEILVRTSLRTVAGPYHRNVDGVRDVANVLGGLSDIDAERIVRARGVTGILTCDVELSVNPFFRRQGALWSRLHANKPPEWLVRDASLGAGAVVLWRVAPVSK